MFRDPFYCQREWNVPSTGGSPTPSSPHFRRGSSFVPGGRLDFYSSSSRVLPLELTAAPRQKRPEVRAAPPRTQGTEVKAVARETCGTRPPALTGLRTSERPAPPLPRSGRAGG